MGERGLSEAAAFARIAAQMPDEDKAALADHVLLNRGTRDLLDEQTDRVLREILDERTCR